MVVQTMLYDMCVSPYTPMSMHLIRVAERLGASSRRPRHPFPALMAGVKPWPCACAQGPTNKSKLHETCSTPHNRNIDHPARAATAKSRWSSDKVGPWRAVFAARKGSRRPARNCIHSFTPGNTDITVLLNHTGHDAAHHGPDEREEEHSARCKVTTKTASVVRRMNLYPLSKQAHDEIRGSTCEILPEGLID